METKTVKPEEYVHHLPCIIAHDGPAAVSTRFIVAQSETPGSSELVASFRGRKLVGLPFELPDGYDAVKMPSLDAVFKKAQPKKEDSEDEDEQPEEGVDDDFIEKDVKFDKTDAFRKMISWHVDYAPLKGLPSDPLYTSITRWLALANVVHANASPVDPDKKSM